MQNTKFSWLKTYLNRRMLVVFLLGFSSGLPLALIGGTLQAWFKTAGISIIVIGYMTLIGQPYTYKWIWAPLLDKYAPNLLSDRRRSWMLLMQLLIIAMIIIMAMYTPDISVKLNFYAPVFKKMYDFFYIPIYIPVLKHFNLSIPLLFILGLVLCLFSATQDIAIDAYRIEVLKNDERGLGSALGIEGYRLAMVASGGVALILADKFGWQKTYLCMAALMLVGVLASFMAPKVQTFAVSKDSLTKMVIASLKDFLKRDKAWLMLILIILYKLGDSFSHVFSSPFLLSMGFTLTEVGMINKVLGVVATLVGVFVGGLFMTKVGLYRSLLTFGILAAVTNLLYMVLAVVGKNFAVAYAAVLIENLCAGMGTAAFVALIMSLCSSQYTATQFALLSSLAALGRIYVGPISGYMVAHLGWAIFYTFSAVVAIPGLLLLIFLRKQIQNRDINGLGAVITEVKPATELELNTATSKA